MGAGGEGDFGGAAAENRDRNDIATGFTVLDLSSDGNLNECLACFGGDKLTLTCRTIKSQLTCGQSPPDSPPSMICS